MCYYVGFGFISILMAGLLYPFIYHNTVWNPYTVWIVAWSITTFFMYGLDKLLSKMGNVRTPEHVLNALAALGGFPGGWLGMALFRHKVNVRKHMSILIVLILSTLGHAALTYYWFFMDSQ
jgi:uncharacterized membrane protein YsdA (DUF1294 family)